MSYKIGPAKYAMAEYEKIKRITFPLKDSMLLIVATEIGCNHDAIIKKIIQLVEDH